MSHGKNALHVREPLPLDRRPVPLLEAKDCDVVVPELPCDDPDAGIERYVTEVEGALADRSEPPLAVGSSLGAATACIVAARRPDQRWRQLAA